MKSYKNDAEIQMLINTLSDNFGLNEEAIKIVERIIDLARDGKKDGEFYVSDFNNIIKRFSLLMML